MLDAPEDLVRNPELLLRARCPCWPACCAGWASCAVRADVAEHVARGRDLDRVDRRGAVVCVAASGSAGEARARVTRVSSRGVIAAKPRLQRAPALLRAPSSSNKLLGR
jgi:hypothetical protein